MVGSPQPRLSVSLQGPVWALLVLAARAREPKFARPASGCKARDSGTGFQQGERSGPGLLQPWLLLQLRGCSGDRVRAT